jgi:hypothetical protein
MHRTLFLSRLLLLILGLTVLSPHFGWEVMASDVHHDPDGAGLVLVDAHEHEHNPPYDHHDEHACGGHMFSHMPTQVSSPAAAVVMRGCNAYSADAGQDFASRDPDSLDRPPRASLA